jgi:hypothetical protein
MDQEIMMISNLLQKLMKMLNLQEGGAFSLYFQETETLMKENLITLFNRFIKSTIQASKSFQWKKKKNS